MERVAALDPQDDRAYEVKVAGPAALIVAKMHKITERLDAPHRLNDKDAHDVYRILRTITTPALVEGFLRLLADPISHRPTNDALDGVRGHLTAGPGAVIAAMAGRAEEGIGDPETVALSASILAGDLMAQIPSTPPSHSDGSGSRT